MVYRLFIGFNIIMKNSKNIIYELIKKEMEEMQLSEGWWADRKKKKRSLNVELNREKSTWKEKQ